jgi:hypothetical protein
MIRRCAAIQRPPPHDRTDPRQRSHASSPFLRAVKNRYCILGRRLGGLKSGSGSRLKRGGTSLVFAAALATTGCTTHQCDPSASTLGLDGGIGTWELLCGSQCSLTWRSGPTVGPWLPFPGQLTYTFVFPPLPALPAGTFADFADATPYVLVAANPPVTFDAMTNFSPAAGELAEFTALSPTSLSVFNASCAGGYLVVTLAVPVSNVAADAGPE